MICPACKTIYPPDHSHCDLDGELLVPLRNTPEAPEETASLGVERAAEVVGAGTAGYDIDFSTAASIHGEPATSATRIESPSGKQRVADSTEHSLHPGTRRATTGISGEYQSTSSRTKSGSSKSRGKPAKRTKREQARAQAETRCGEVLGSYKLRAVLGFGGMGAVYAAEHVRLGRHVALKLLHPQYAERREAVIRFFQEAQAVNRIRHKNIVDVSDLVELENGNSFIIMELLDGESLGNRIRVEGLLDIPSTISILIQICDGLSAAHSVDIVHRDLKPDNIFLTQTDDGDLLVKLLDFGVAKLVGKDSDVGLKTAAGSVVGTPAFMSPEQAGGLEVDLRSDIYSLGAIMYQLFTGQHVFRGKSFGDFVQCHLNHDPVPPRSTPGGQGMAPDLERIILRCLNKSPNARYANAADLRSELVEYLRQYAADHGSKVESASGIYRLSGIHSLSQAKIPNLGPPPFTGPPETLHGSSSHDLRGPRRPVPPPAALETALMVGDLPAVSVPRNMRSLWLGLGAAGVLTAIILAIVLTRSGSSAESTVAGSATIDASVEVSKPKITPLSDIVTIRVRTNVIARIFAAGGNDALCGTPCDLRIDRNEGDTSAGSSSRNSSRNYVVRAQGYVDSRLTLDLAKPPGVIDVELIKIAVQVQKAPDAGTQDLVVDNGSGAKGSDSMGTKGTSSKGNGSKGSDNKGSGNKGSGNKGSGNKGNKGSGDKGSGDGTGVVPAGQTLDPFGKKR